MRLQHLSGQCMCAAHREVASISASSSSIASCHCAWLGPGNCGERFLTRTKLRASWSIQPHCHVCELCTLIFMNSAGVPEAHRVIDHAAGGDTVVCEWVHCEASASLCTHLETMRLVVKVLYHARHAVDEVVLFVPILRQDDAPAAWPRCLRQ